MFRKIFEKKSRRDLFAISASTLSNQIVGLFRGFFVAKFLGPTDYGILKATQLISMLDKYGSLGFRSVAKREVIHLREAGELDKSIKARNVAYSGEFLLSCLLFLAGIISSFFFESTMITVAILLASGQLFSSKILGIFNTDVIIKKKIVLYSKVLFWSGLISSILIILTVPFFKIYAVLGIPILAAIVSCWVYHSAIGVGLKFDFELKELVRLLRIGIPIAVFTLSYGSYKYAERISIGTYHGIVALGFYSLAAMPVDYMMTFLLLPVKIRSVNVYELLGRGEFRNVHRMVIKETAILFVIAVVSIPFLWFAVDFLISVFLSDYSPAIIISKILILSIPIRIISCYSNIVLISSVVNKQALIGPVQFVVTVLFVVSILILRQIGQASFINIAIADAGGYAVFHICCIALYKKHFVDVYLKNSRD